MERAKPTFRPEAKGFVPDNRAKYLQGRKKAARWIARTLAPVAPVNRLRSSSRSRRRYRRSTVAPPAGDGIWQRFGNQPREIRPLLLFRDRVDFEPSLHFHDDVSGFARPLMRREVLKAVDREIRRAVR